MRWTDLPRDPDSTDQREAPVIQRGEWEDLKQRLERLPAGHPSAPDAHEDGAAAGWDEEGRLGRDGANEAGGARSVADGDAGPGRQQRAARTEARRASGVDTHSGEPYRPWFVSGESPDPWFWADPGA